VVIAVRNVNPHVTREITAASHDQPRCNSRPMKCLGEIPGWSARMVHTAYLASVLETNILIACVAHAKKKLRRVKFDAFIVCGNSGTIFGGALAFAMKKGLILVRKDGCHHSSLTIEGDDSYKTLIFLDDFIDTGTTRNYVITQMLKSEVTKRAKLIGTYLYAGGGKFVSTELSSDNFHD
jgi:hypothetical protein